MAPPEPDSPVVGRSIRARLLLWLSVPLLVFLSVDAWSSYRAALRATEFAYDRLLVTSAHAIADLIRLERGKLVIQLPHAALEIYGTATDSEESASRGRMQYRVGFHGGEYLAGDADMKPYAGRPAAHPLYRSMIELYDSQDGPAPVRVAALMQPIESYDGTRLVIVQVAEPSQHRVVFAERILRDTLLRQGLLLAVLLLLLWTVSNLALRPLDALTRRLAQRSERDLSLVNLPRVPLELASLIRGFNGVLERLRRAQEQQRRFVADASHQLCTPLTVLQLQADAGLKGDIPAGEALQAISHTSQRATHLAQQLLSLARAQQARYEEPMEEVDLGEVAREVAVELSPLIARRQLDFEFAGVTARLRTHHWMVREVVTNLLKNAIEFTPREGRLGIEVRQEGAWTEIVVWDTGPGLSEAMMDQVFKPFATDRPTRGAGLGLAICQDLARAAGASLSLANGGRDGGPGLQARLGFIAPGRAAPVSPPGPVP